jgi:O-antigen/teichoic acid export membrane protein
MRFKQKINSLLSKLGLGQEGHNQSLKMRLIKASASLFGLKVFSAGLGFVISIVLARILGASDYGLYVYVFVILDLLILLGNSGIDTLLVRDVAIYQSNSSWGLLHGLLKWSNQFILGVCAFLILSTIAVLQILGDRIEPSMHLCFLIALLFLPIACLRNRNISAMNGLQQFFKAHIPEFFIRPILFLTSIGLGYLILKHKVSAPIISGIHVTVSAICLGIIMIFLNQGIPKLVWQEKPQYQVKTWLKTSLPLLFYASLNIFYSSADTIMLGAMTNVTLVAIYDAILKGKLIMYMVNNSVSSVLQPNVASLYALGKTKDMERLVKKSNLILFGIIFGMIVVLIALSKFYMSLFGSEFLQGQMALIVLCLLTIIDNIAPFNVLLLNMTGYENYTLLGIGISSILNVILNWLWIPQWGIMGAIIATGVSLTLLNLYATLVVYKKLKINCTIFAL